MVLLKTRPFVQSSSDMQAPRQPPVCVCVFVFVFVLFFLEMPLFPNIFCTTVVAFSLYREYVVRSFIPNGPFLPSDHGLDIRHQLM